MKTIGFAHNTSVMQDRFSDHAAPRGLRTQRISLLRRVKPALSASRRVSSPRKAYNNSITL
jgi:hypothetical protein